MRENERQVTLDEALQNIGGWRNPFVIRSNLAAGGLWFAGAIAALLPVFSHDMEERAGPTVVHEFNLTDDRLWLHDFLQTLFWIGFTVGLVLSGRYSDEMGRRPVLVISGVAGIIFMALSAIAPDLITYALCRVLVGTSYGGSGLVAFVGATEWVSNSYGRAFVGTVGLNVFYISGELVSVALGSFSGWGWDEGWTWWRGLTLAAACVCALACLPAVFMFTESPRWLLAQGLVTEAQELIDMAAIEYDVKVANQEASLSGYGNMGLLARLTCGDRRRRFYRARNVEASTKLAPIASRMQGQLPPDSVEDKVALRETQRQDCGAEAGAETYERVDFGVLGNGAIVAGENMYMRNESSQSSSSSSSYYHLFSNPKMRRLTMANAILWFSVAFSYFGLNQASAQLVPDSINVYLSISCLAFVEFPANVAALYATESQLLGRQVTCACAATLGGICCIVVAFIQAARSPNLVGMMAFFGLVGKLGVTVTFSAMYVLTGESYSTTLRSAGVSAASTAARLGSMISPLFGFSVPAVASLLVWGIVLIIAGAITRLFIAETKHIDHDNQDAAFDSIELTICNERAVSNDKIPDVNTRNGRNHSTERWASNRPSDMDGQSPVTSALHQ